MNQDVEDDEMADKLNEIEAAANGVKLASLIEHIKQNNVSYLIGMLVMYQMGLLDRAFTYGTGICA